MKRLFSLLTAGAVLAGAGCFDDPLAGPASDTTPANLNQAASPAQPVSVLNWNIYIGTDVDAVIGALNDGDPTNDFDALNTAIAELAATDFPSRAGAIADEIDRYRPDVVGLQEVSILDVDLAAIGGPAFQLDFLTVLQHELMQHGLNYSVAVVGQTIDAQPVLPPGLTVRTIDRDAILIASDRVTLNGSVAQLYANNVGPVAPGITLVRGFVAIDAMIGGRPYTVATTHLEPDLGGIDLSLLRAAQAGELMAALGTASPAIVMGDFNDGEGSPMHQVVSGAAFTDVWRTLRPGTEGLTCCHASDLSNPLNVFDQRIDYVFVRGTHPVGEAMGQIDRLGEVPADRLAGPFHAIWPSDHAGLAVGLVVPPALAALP